MGDAAIAFVRSEREAIFQCLLSPEDQYLTSFSRTKGCLSDSEWRRRLEDALLHISVELLCNEESRTSFILFRLIEQINSLGLSRTIIQCAFACACRCTIPSYPGVIDGFLSFDEVDAFARLARWPCTCSSACYLAARMCEGRSAVELAIRSMNHVALDRIFQKHSVPLESRLLSRVFRRNARFPSEQVGQVRNVILSHIQEQEDLIASCQLIGTLEDGKEGGIDSLPIEKIGQWGRQTRSLLPDLLAEDGSDLLTLLAGTSFQTGGRDVIFRFLLDMKVAPSNQRASIFEYAVKNNPSFWIPQSNSSIAPPFMLIGMSDPTPSFLRHYCHLDAFLQARCQCRMCRIWRHEAAFRSLREFVHQASSTSTLMGYKLIRELSHTTIKKDLCLEYISTGADLRVTDFTGNSCVHLALDLELLQSLARHGANFSSANQDGFCPLELSIMRNDTKMTEFLLKFCRCSISISCLKRIFSLIEVNPELLNLVQTSLDSVTIEAPTPNALLELQQLRQRLASEQKAFRDKKNQLERDHRSSLEHLKRETEKEIHEMTSEMSAKVETFKSELTSALRRAVELDNTVSLMKKEQILMERDTEDMREKISKLERLRSKDVAKREVERKVIETEREARECTLCMESVWDTALLCGHCYCNACAKAACKEKCPTCTKNTSGKFIKLFNCRK